MITIALIALAITTDAAKSTVGLPMADGRSFQDAYRHNLRLVREGNKEALENVNAVVHIRDQGVENVRPERRTNSCMDAASRFEDGFARGIESGHGDVAGVQAATTFALLRPQHRNMSERYTQYTHETGFEEVHGASNAQMVSLAPSCMGGGVDVVLSRWGTRVGGCSVGESRIPVNDANLELEMCLNEPVFDGKDVIKVWRSAEPHTLQWSDEGALTSSLACVIVATPDVDAPQLIRGARVVVRSPFTTVGGQATGRRPLCDKVTHNQGGSRSVGDRGTLLFGVEPQDVWAHIQWDDGHGGAVEREDFSGLAVLESSEDESALEGAGFSQEAFAARDHRLEAALRPAQKERRLLMAAWVKQINSQYSKQ